MPQRIHPKPVNMREIFIKFSTEEQCLEYVEKMHWPDGIVRCSTCGDKNVKRVLKRGVIGQFHKLSGKHLHRCLAEFEYRFNHRTDADVFIGTVQRLCGFKPLRFAALTSEKS